MNTVDAAIKALLAGFRVGESGPPSDGGWQGAPGASAFRNYVMVAFQRSDVDGPLNLPNHEVDRRFTCTSVSATAEGARITNNNVVAALAGERVSTTARVSTRPITVERFGDVDPDDTVSPRVWFVVSEFSAPTVPKP